MDGLKLARHWTSASLNEEIIGMKMDKQHEFQQNHNIIILCRKPPEQFLIQLTNTNSFLALKQKLSRNNREEIKHKFKDGKNFEKIEVNFLPRDAPHPQSSNRSQYNYNEG